MMKNYNKVPWKVFFLCNNIVYGIINIIIVFLFPIILGVYALAVTALWVVAALALSDRLVSATGGSTGLCLLFLFFGG